VPRLLYSARPQPVPPAALLAVVDLKPPRPCPSLLALKNELYLCLVVSVEGPILVLSLSGGKRQGLNPRFIFVWW
jgi:hypothetical protein